MTETNGSGAHIPHFLASFIYLSSPLLSSPLLSSPLCSLEEHCSPTQQLAETSALCYQTENHWRQAVLIFRVVCTHCTNIFLSDHLF